MTNADTRTLKAWLAFVGLALHKGWTYADVIKRLRNQGAEVVAQLRHMPPVHVDPPETYTDQSDPPPKKPTRKRKSKG